MTEEKIRQFLSMAERIVSRCVLGETRFCETEDGFRRDTVTAVTEGHLAGRRYAVWLPVVGQMYRDESYRPYVIKRAREAWRVHAKGSLVPMHVLTEPKGKLPA